MISRVISVLCAVSSFSVPVSLGPSTSILRMRTVTMHLRLILHWYRARMWQLVVAALRHDEDSSELTSVAQLRSDWVVAHVPTCGTMVSSRFQRRCSWVHFCSHFRGSRREQVGLGSVADLAASTSAPVSTWDLPSACVFPGFMECLTGCPRAVLVGTSLGM